MHLQVVWCHSRLLRSIWCSLGCRHHGYGIALVSDDAGSLPTAASAFSLLQSADPGPQSSPPLSETCPTPCSCPSDLARASHTTRRPRTVVVCDMVAHLIRQPHRRLFVELANVEATRR